MFTFLVALLLIVPSEVLGQQAQNKLTIDTHMEYYHDWFWGYQRVPGSGTTCRIYAQNGQSGIESKIGPSDDMHVAMSIHFSEYTSILQNTRIWTSCSDALLMDSVLLADQNNIKMWGQDGGEGWCLSTVWYTAWWFKGVIGSPGVCHRELEFNADGYVYYYENPYFSKNSAQVPTDEEVRACEDDKSRDQKECDELVNQIFIEEDKHPEYWHRMPQEGEDVRGLAMATSAASGVDSWALYAFAGLGAAFLIVQGAKCVKKKTQQKEFTPLKAQDEL